MSLRTLRAENGGDFINDTDAHTGQWHAAVFMDDTIIESITMPDFANEAAILSPLAFAPGAVLFGEITAIKLVSGTVQMINY